jgi:hypothetical protein
MCVCARGGGVRQWFPSTHVLCARRTPSGKALIPSPKPSPGRPKDSPRSGEGGIVGARLKVAAREAAGVANEFRGTRPTASPPGPPCRQRLSPLFPSLPCPLHPRPPLHTQGPFPPLGHRFSLSPPTPCSQSSSRACGPLRRGRSSGGTAAAESAGNPSSHPCAAHRGPAAGPRAVPGALKGPAGSAAGPTAGPGVL